MRASESEAKKPDQNQKSKISGSESETPKKFTHPMTPRPKNPDQNPRTEKCGSESETQKIRVSESEAQKCGSKSKTK